MSVDETNEKRFESDIEAFFISPAGGYAKGAAEYDATLGMYPSAVIDFIKRTQEDEWNWFCQQNKVNPEHKFCVALANACAKDGGSMLSVLRDGFKHRGQTFHVCYFKPESEMNRTAWEHYRANRCECYRQWYYSATSKKSVDMVLVVNGLPLFAFELKNQYTGQCTEDAMTQWMHDRDPREVCFRFNTRVLAFFCVDHVDVRMTTRLEQEHTFFLPFNQGSGGAGQVGGAGNPPNENGYPSAYLWEQVFQKDSMLDIVQKFLQVTKKVEKKPNGTKDTKRALIFPRFHQLDVVRKLIADAKARGAGHNYLIQHSAGSGKSNSIAWTAYRLASLHDDGNKPVFRSVIVVTDRKVLDQQLQETISSFERKRGFVETIDRKRGKTSQDLKDAINNGARIIVTTLQKFPVIYKSVEKHSGRNFAIIVDEAHSSQTGSSAMKMKTALADTEQAVLEFSLRHGINLDEVDEEDRIVLEMVHQGRHKNLSFFAFTATPKGTTLEMFGEEQPDNSFKPFHVYSMRQAIEEKFILNVLDNYMTYDTCFRIVKAVEENPLLPANKAAKKIRRFQQEHPRNIAEKSAVIVDTFLKNTSQAISGKGKMMVVAPSRVTAVLYFQEIKRLVAERKLADVVKPMVAFSGKVDLNGETFTEPGLNVRPDGTHISEEQTKAEFRQNFNILVVAMKFQTGFDEPLLHTMIVDKKLKGVDAVQTLSRLNRIAPDKDSTFILDFVNDTDSIQAAFQQFYQETDLEEEVNVDLIYDTQKKLRDFAIYDDSDIQRFIGVYAAASVQGKDDLGKMTSVLKPACDAYNDKTDDERYQFRRTLRKLTKWYEYVSQILRMFDRELHEEYLFCSYLLCLLPADQTKPVDLNGKLRLEYYKLKETYTGKIALKKEDGTFGQAKGNSSDSKDEEKPLDEILKSINERYNGIFSERDKVLLYALLEKLKANTKLSKLAKNTDKQIFATSIFPTYFDAVTRQSYVESQNTYTSLFEDTAKYNAVMTALAEAIYRLCTSIDDTPSLTEDIEADEDFHQEAAEDE